MTRRRQAREHEIRQANTDPRYQAARNRTPDPHWRDDRECANADPEAFYPLSITDASTRDALAYCHRCPVTDHCLAAALDAGDQEGIWGETLPQERRAMGHVWRGTFAERVAARPAARW